MNNDKTTIIIVNWNGEKLLRENLPSVLKQDFPNYEILIVDNGSSDHSVQFIKDLMKKDKRIDIIKLDRNFGFVGGNNIGMEKILKDKKCKYIILLNNDVKVERNWLSNLLKGFNKKNIGICTSNIFLYFPYQKIEIIQEENSVIDSLSIDELNYHPLIFKNGYVDQGAILSFPLKLSVGDNYSLAIPYRPQNKGVLNIKIKKGNLNIKINGSQFKVNKSSKFKISPKGDLVFQNAGTNFIKEKLLFEDRFLFNFRKELKDEIVDAGCGGAMAIRSDLLKKLGLFDDRYYAYLEDTELSYRFKKAGFKTKFVSNAICYHYFWGTSGAQITETQTFYGTRNRLLFIKKYFGFWRFAYYWLRTFGRTIIWGLKALTFDKTARMYLKSYVRALTSALIR